MLMCLGVMPGHAEKRAALVVGNAQYKNPGNVLSNPKNDAGDLAEVLRGLGFEVLQTIDADKRGFDLALQQFARLATGADVALFFYAGHAMQHHGRNYLMPIDAELEDEISLPYQMVMLETVQSAINRATGVKIMILDACRNNPVANRLIRSISGPTRDMGSMRGLARVEKAEGMVVAYATGASEVAEDGRSRNSPYSSALLKRLQEPGLEVEMMFRRVAQDVTAQTNGRQRPETVISLLSEYYLNTSDRLAWEKIKDADDPAQFRAFMVQFPSSALALSARSRLEIIELTARARQESAQVRQELARMEQERIKRGSAPSVPDGPPLDEVTWGLVKDSRDADQLRRFIRQFPQGAQRVEAEQRMAALAAEAAEAAKLPPPSQPDRAEITRSLQFELKRVGCFDGAVDGEFGSTTRAALLSFAKLAAVRLPQEDPSPDVLKAIRGFDKRVCPLLCQAGERAEGERCIRLLCAAGQVLKDGSCVAERPVAAPKGGSAKCFNFQGRQFCE
jgi:uncharacterized caspase-like protein